MLTDGGRLVFLDLARGIAVVTMLLQHATIMFAVDNGDGSPVGVALLLLGTAPAAPVFMVSMGFLYGAATDRGVRAGVLRGLRLFALGYALNLARFALPLLVGGSQVQDGFGTPAAALLAVDILQLAGLSFVVLALVKPLLLSPWWAAALALAVFAVSPALWGLGGDSPWPTPLWGIGDSVSFPLFPWLGYPLLGLACAGFARRATGAVRLARQSALAGLALLAVGIPLASLDLGGLLTRGDYFRSGLPVQLMICGFVLLWLPALWWLAERLRQPAPGASREREAGAVGSRTGDPRAGAGVFRAAALRSGRVAARYLGSLSRLLLPVYFIQWVIYGWTALATGLYGSLPAAWAPLIGIAVLVVSHLLALGYERALTAVREWRAADNRGAA